MQKLGKKGLLLLSFATLISVAQIISLIGDYLLFSKIILSIFLLFLALLLIMTFMSSTRLEVRNRNDSHNVKNLEASLLDRLKSGEKDLDRVLSEILSLRKESFEGLTNIENGIADNLQPAISNCEREVDQVLRRVHAIQVDLSLVAKSLNEIRILEEENRSEYNKNVDSSSESLSAIKREISILNTLGSEQLTRSTEIAALSSQIRRRINLANGILENLEPRIVRKFKTITDFSVVRSRIESHEARSIASLEEFGETISDALEEWREGVQLFMQKNSHKENLNEQLMRTREEMDSKLSNSLQEIDNRILSIADLIGRSRHDSLGEYQAYIREVLSSELMNTRKNLRRHTTDTVRDSTRQVESLIKLIPEFQNVDPMIPPTGGYALDAQALLHLIQLLRKHKPKKILELGGGVSTIWMAAICQPFGTKVISVDHLEGYQEITRENVMRLGFGDTVEFRLAPLKLVEINGETFNWYDPSVFNDIESIDLLFIDGPPESTGDRARHPAFPLLKSKLTPNALVVLDDTHRRSEAELLASWVGQDELMIHIDANMSRLGVILRKP